MSNREYRPKASEIFATADLVFSQKVGFAAAFPGIKTLKVTATERGRIGFGGERTHYFTEASAGEFIDCSNGACYNGGMSLGRHLREMVSERKTEAEFTDTCKGNEASPKGRRVYRKCFNIFRGKISIEYHKQTGVAEAPLGATDR